MGLSWTATDTIVGIATAPGRGGVAIVRLSGERALELAAALFDALPKNFESHRLYYGRFCRPNDGLHLDTGLLVVMQAPNSYTGETVVELHLHGGEAVPASVVAALLEQGGAGVRMAEPGEFTFRAFLNQRLNLMQAEAVQELVESQSSLAQRFALQRLEGRWQNAVGELQKRLSLLLSNLEASLDFPDEAFEILDRSAQLAEVTEARRQIAAWLANARWQRLAKEPWTICLVGPANVGKSTLFNALLGETRAIVDASPGTTRDYIDAQLQIEGVPVRLIDTAGFRETTGMDLVEEKGIARSMQWLSRADLILWVDDPQSHAKNAPLRQRYHQEHTTRWRTAVNKIDLISPDDFNRLRDTNERPLMLSAVRAQGLEPLRSLIQEQCRACATQVQQMAFCVNDRQRQALLRADEHLAQAQEQLQGQTGEELIAQEVWAAGRALEELAGRSLGPEVIEAIFQNFCIGK